MEDCAIHPLQYLSTTNPGFDLRFAGLERQFLAGRNAALAHRQDHGDADIGAGDRR